MFREQGPRPMASKSGAGPCSQEDSVKKRGELKPCFCGKNLSLELKHMRLPKTGMELGKIQGLPPQEEGSKGLGPG